MITPYNPSRGIDLYIDAAGEDDWQIDREKYYLFGLMACGASPEWIEWMGTHQTQYGGMVHWSAGTFGAQESRLENKKGKCRELLISHPWLQTGIYVFDKAAFKASVGRDKLKYEAVKKIWSEFLIAYLANVIPNLKKLVPDDQWGCLNIRNIVFNNPKKGGLDTGLIERQIKEQFGRTPMFVPAGHYGIDALDGVLWAFQRCFNSGKADCLPRSANDFSKDLRVVVMGVKSRVPVLLRNLNDIDKFRRAEV